MPHLASSSIDRKATALLLNFLSSTTKKYISKKYFKTHLRSALDWGGALTAGLPLLEFKATFYHKHLIILLVFPIKARKIIELSLLFLAG